MINTLFFRCKACKQVFYSCLYAKDFDTICPPLGNTIDIGDINIQGERGHRVGYYTSPQSFIIKFSYSLA